MQNYNETSSRMLRLPTWTTGNGSGGGAVYSNRQSYFGQNCDLSNFPVPVQHPPPTPIQAFYPPPPPNNRLPVFHLRSSAPGIGTIIQQGPRELGLATGIGASSSSCHKDPVTVSIPNQPNPTVSIPSARRQRKSVIIARSCNNVTETCRAVSCAAMASRGNGATITKRPRGRPPGKKNRLPVTQVSPLVQHLESDRMNFEGSTVATSNNFGVNPYGPYSALFSGSHHDAVKDYEFADNQQRCKLLIEYIREKTCDSPERFNTFLNLMKLYTENGDWKTLYERTDTLFHDYPEILTAVKGFVSASDGSLPDDSSCVNNFCPGDNVSCVRGNAGLETSTSHPQRYFQNMYAHQSMPAVSEFLEGADAANNSDEGLFVQGHRYAPNWLTNVAEPRVMSMPFETHPQQQQQCFAPDVISTYNSLEPILKLTAGKPKISEHKHTRVHILEGRNDFDDEFHKTSTSFAYEVETTHAVGMQETNKQTKVMDFRKDTESINHGRVQTVPMIRKKSGKLISDPKLYGLLSAIHLFGNTANDILFQTNVGSITNEKLEEKLSRLIFNETDDTKWKKRLLRVAYPASRLTFPHIFQCLHVLLRFYTPLHFLDAEDPSSTSSSTSKDTVIDDTGEFKFVDYENFERLGKSYYQYPDSFVHPNYIGRDQNGMEVLNDKYFLVASTENQIRDKSDYEITMENLEDVRYELDMLDHTCSCAIEELTKFEKERIVPKERHRQVVQLIYANDGKIIREGILKQPELFIPHVLKWLEVKKHEWTELRNRLNLSVNEKLRNVYTREEEITADSNCSPNHQDEDAGENICPGKLQFCWNLGLHSTNPI